MIKLYSFGPAFNLADPSPFVAKIDLHLRANNIRYESIASADNLQTAPKGKLPYIDDNGTIVCDSSFIVEHLKEHHNADIDSWLSDEQKATAHLINKSLEENLYWCIVHSRWINDDTWPIVKANFFDAMPFPLNKIIPIVARRSVRANINGHGMGKHSDEEIMHIAKCSLQSLSTLLDEKDFFFGDQLSSLDITAYVMISSLTQASLDTPMNHMAKEFDNLVRYTQKIQQTYYPELN